eukprot:s1035_g3.t1
MASNRWLCLFWTLALATLTQCVVAEDGADVEGDIKIPPIVLFNYKFNLLNASKAQLKTDPLHKLVLKNVKHTIALFGGDVEQVHFYDDDQCLKELKKLHQFNGHQLAEGFLSLRHGKYKSDLCRLAQLWRLQFVQPDYLDPDTTFATVRSMCRKEIFQAFLAATPHNELIGKNLRIFGDWLQKRQHNSEGSNIGPHLMSLGQPTKRHDCNIAVVDQDTDEVVMYPRVISTMNDEACTEEKKLIDSGAAGSNASVAEASPWAAKQPSAIPFIDSCGVTSLGPSLLDWLPSVPLHFPRRHRKINLHIDDDSYDFEDASEDDKDLLQVLKKNCKHTVNTFGGDVDKVYFYDDKDCTDELRKMDDFDGDKLADGFGRFQNGRFKSDLCRLAQLYTYGGYYFDTDILPVTSVRKVLEPETTFATARSTFQGDVFQAM